jgi:uncharacterized membrane protein YcaP (DUF421 family)
MDWFQDFGVVFLRVVTILPLLLAVTLFMGRRSIGQMPVFDLLVILTLGSVVGADIAEPSVHHLLIVFAVLMIGLLQKLFSYSSLHLRWFGKLITFEPLIVVYKGKIVYRNLKKAQYSIDGLLQLLRENQVFDLSSVELAILEANGELSLLEQKTQPVSYPVIKEGKIQTLVLNQLNLQQSWLEKQLQQRNIQLTDVFLATADKQHTLHLTRYEEKEHVPLPPLYH